MIRNPSTLLLACALGVATAVAGAGDTVTFNEIPGASSANDLTPDGRFFVGETTDGPYIYDTSLQMMTMLPPDFGATAVAVSNDGKVVLGSWYEEFNPGQWAQVACRWTEASGQWTSLGFLPTAGFCPSRSNGYELSADGSVAVGLSWVGCSGRGFRWTEAGGMIELESLLNGSNRASVVSADGNVIGGFAQSNQRTPAMWGGSGIGVILDPPAGAALGEIEGINDSGTVLLGTFNTKATKFTNSGTVRTTIGSGSLLPGWVGHAMDISNNGTIIGFDSLAGNRRAWIQLGGTGPLVDLREYAEANGANIPVDLLLEVPQAISADGTFIIGHGFSGAWTIRIASSIPCPGDLAPAGGNGVVDGADLGTLLAAWGTPAADLDGDGVTGGSDLGVLLGGWGNCPVAPGACCTGDDCIMTSALACSQLGGVFLGNGVPCSPDACVNNDHCVDAVDITGSINGQVVNGNNTTATPELFSAGDPELPAGSPSCQWLNEPWQAHSTVWYTFVAPANGHLTIELCQSTPVPFFDSLLTVYTGTCGNLVEYACDEDGCSNSAPYYSRLELPFLTPGQTYYLCVMNSGGWLHSVPGPFKLGLWSNNGPGGGAN